MNPTTIQDYIKDLEILYVFQFDTIKQKYDYFKSSKPNASCHIDTERLESSISESIVNNTPIVLPKTEIINIDAFNFEITLYASLNNKIMGSIKDISDLLNKIDYYEKQLQTRDTIIEINHAILDYKNTNDLLDTILQKVVELFEFPECGTILSLDDGWLTIASSVGYDSEMCKSFKMKYADTFQWHMSKNGYKGPIIINNLRQEMLSKGYDLLPTINGQEILSCLSVPITIHNKLFGMINIDTTKNHFYNDYHIKFIKFIKEQVSLVIIKHLMYEEIRQLSEQDTLTKLLNRTTFKSKFDAICKNYKQMHLINIDIDRFKNINDDYGHDAGDEVLIYFAKELQSVFDTNSIVGRISGDEFAICTHNFSEKEIIKTLESFKLRLMNQPLKYKENIIPFSFSYGISSINKDGLEFEELYKTADIRMYINKKINHSKS